MQKLFFIGILALVFGCNTTYNKSTAIDEKSKERFVKGCTIVSPHTPKVQIKVADEFEYIGKFDFEIIANSDEYPDSLKGKPVAAGERLVFVKSDRNKHV
jgi:hypothetical protein